MFALLCVVIESTSIMPFHLIYTSSISWGIGGGGYHFHVPLSVCMDQFFSFSLTDSVC